MLIVFGCLSFIPLCGRGRSGMIVTSVKAPARDATLSELRSHVVSK